MTKEQQALLALIKEGLKYKKADDNHIEFYRDSLFKPGLSEQGLLWALEELVKSKVIIQNKLAYEQEKPESTRSRVPQPTTSHTRAVFQLVLDRKKLDILDADAIKISAPSFDVIKGNVIVGEVPCHIANTGDYQHHICKELLVIETGRKYKMGDWVSEGELEDTYSLSLTGESAAFKSARWVKDAVYKINAKIHERFGIEKFIDYRKSNIRIVTENFK